MKTHNHTRPKPSAEQDAPFTLAVGSTCVCYGAQDTSCESMDGGGGIKHQTYV